MNNNQLLTTINNIIETIDTILIDQMGVMPPEQYDVSKREGRIYVTATFDPMMIGRNLKTYEHPDTLRVIRKALGGLPVVFTQRTGFRYVVLASGKLNLPKNMDFPGFGERDTFRLGICLRGEVAPQTNRLRNVIIGSNQGMGKSNILKLLTHQARFSGWQLYLCDPDGHTFHPDAWNPIAAAPVASSPEDLLIVMDRIYEEIASRAALYQKAAVDGISPADIDEYNARAQGASLAPLQRIGLSIDEANTYMGNKKIFKPLADLLRRGRKWGLSIFLAGHEWHKDVVPAEMNDMLQTRIALSYANQEAANVVMRSHRWGKWVMGKPQGRGVIRIDQYQPMQFYRVTEEQEREWLSRSEPAAAPLPENEALLVERSLDEAEGKMTTELLEGWGLGHREARELVTAWELRGWLAKDPARSNARYITPKLADLLPNRQTCQSLPNRDFSRQTAAKPSQTQTFAGGLS